MAEERGCAAVLPRAVCPDGQLALPGDSECHEVAECAGDNIFIVKDGVIKTPPTDAGILEGITRDTVITLANASNVRLLVVESGRDALGEWRRHERDVAQDYAAVFGAPPGRVGKLAIMSDADHTRGTGEALVADVRFSRR